MKKTVALLLILVLLCGCTTALGETAWKAEEPVTIKWVSWDYDTDEEIAFVNELLAKYKEVQPNITVEYEYVANDQYQTWLQTQLMGGTAPEMFLVRHAWGQQYIYDGTVVDMTPYLTEQENRYNTGQPWIDTFQNGIVAQVQDLTNGKYGSIPLGSIICKIIYNKDYFEAAGISEFPKTYEEFLNACEKLQNAGYVPMVQGMKVSEGGGYHWFERLVSDQLIANLVPAMDKNGTGLIETNEIARAIAHKEIDLTVSPWKDAFPIIKDLTKYWYPGFTSMINKDAWDLFTVGEAAMTFINFGMDVKAFYDDPERTFEIGIAEFPTIGTDTTEYATGKTFEIGGAPQSCYCIPQSASPAEVDAAIDFLMFLSSPEIQQFILEKTWTVISVKDVEPENEVLKGVTFKNEISPLKLFETYYSKQFFDDSVMLGQLYLLDQMSLDDYMRTLQDELIQITEEYVSTQGWCDENNWGEKK